MRKVTICTFTNDQENWPFVFIVENTLEKIYHHLRFLCSGLNLYRKWNIQY